VSSDSAAPTEAATAPYVGRRRAVVVEPRHAPAREPEPAAKASSRGRPLAGAVIPATAAAALTLVATGVGVATNVDGSAVARDQLRAEDKAGMALASVRNIGDASTDAVNAVADQRSTDALRASRDAERSRLAKAAALQAEQAHQWVLPLKHYVLSSPFGMRWGKLHAGEDFATPIGSVVHAISSGVIVFAGVEGGYGNKVEIRHWDGTCSWYGHLSKIKVKVGQQVDSDQVIALSGDSGHSTGPHLHLEIHPHGKGPVDPMPWLRAHGLHP
jgi:murein DD-endopeptidase MepM/ murein hydrolase activator NlpD